MTAKKKTVPTVEELALVVAGLRGDVKAAEAAHDALNDQVRSLEKEVATAKTDATFERDRANALEQRLQRMSGYLDRVMDEENQYKDSPTQVVKARPEPKGPRISQVNMPNRDNSRPNLYAMPGSDADNGHYPARNF